MISILLAAATLAAAAPASVGVSTVVASAQQRMFARCTPQGEIDISSLLSSAPGRSDCEFLTIGEVQDLVAYAACRDLQGATDGCAALGGWVRGSSAVAACRMTAINDRFVFQVLRGGDAASLCVKILEAEGKRGPAVGRGCAGAIAAVRAGTPLAVCAALKREKLIGARDDCADTQATWEGNTEACSPIKDAADRLVCREQSALVAGLRDPARCASSPACRVLSARDPRACDGLLVGFSRSVCGRMGKAVAETRRLVAREAEAKKHADAAVKAKAKIAAKAAKFQYQKGQPMRRSGNVKNIMERLEKGLPPKPAPVDDGANAPPEGGGIPPAAP